MKHRVSVVMNCHNGAEYLRETLECLKNQSYSDFEVIFWDNCSDDETSDIAQSFDSRMKYFRSDLYTTLGEARNEAVSRAEGEYIAFLDCDDIWEREKLQLQVTFMDEHNDVGLLLTNFKIMNMLSNKTIASNNPSTDMVLGYSSFLCDYKYCMSTSMIRKSALEKLSMWFDSHLQYVEEYDFFARIAYRWNVYYLSSVTTTYRVHKNMNSIKLSGEKPDEYRLVLRHLRDDIEGFDNKYPTVKNWLCYISDFFLTKNFLSEGNNISARITIRPYIQYNYRALVFYLLSFLPSAVSKGLYHLFYRIHM